MFTDRPTLLELQGLTEVTEYLLKTNASDIDVRDDNEKLQFTNGAYKVKQTIYRLGVADYYKIALWLDKRGLNSVALVQS